MSSSKKLPAVIGHRGASGYRPENTLAAYELAARLGADRIEPDLVPTRDGALVLRHESEITHSTDVASRPDLASRRAARLVDGEVVSGWFTEDLDLAELRSLRAVEPRPGLRPGTTVYDGLYQVPTFAELLALAESLRSELGREIVVTAEVKDPERYAAEGFDVVEMVLAELDRLDLDAPDSPGRAPVLPVELPAPRPRRGPGRAAGAAGRGRRRRPRRLHALGAARGLDLRGDPRAGQGHGAAGGRRRVARPGHPAGRRRAPRRPRRPRLDAAQRERVPAAGAADRGLRRGPRTGARGAPGLPGRRGRRDLHRPPRHRGGGPPPVDRPASSCPVPAAAAPPRLPPASRADPGAAAGARRGRPGPSVAGRRVVER